MNYFSRILILFKLTFLMNANYSFESEIDYFIITHNATISQTLQLQEGYTKAYTFLCPKDFYIDRLHYKFKFKSDELYTFFGLVPEGYSFTIQNKIFSNLTSYESSLENPCGTLNYCVGFQACLFKFSNEFCCFDATPNRGNVILATITCEKDELLESKLINLPKNIANSLLLNVNQTIYLAHTSFIDSGIKNYKSVTILPLISNESDIFDVKCPTITEVFKIGYRGNCTSIPIKKEMVVNEIWSVLARSEKHCYEELLNTYCSFLYNASGGCIPPHLLEKIIDNEITFNFEVLPQKGSRPDMTIYKKEFTDDLQRLIPAKLGFMILTYSDPIIVLQLLELIYRPYHHYVIHVDKRHPVVREELKKLLKVQNFEKPNIIILPDERSFLSAWASYGLIRAILECLEELLRQGIWDFALNLSAADLPIRDVDDLAAALAPYRGYNFIMPIYERNISEDNQVWHGCGGFTFNVKGEKGRSPCQEIFNISTLWSIFSRNFSEFLVSKEEKQGLEYFQYYLMTHLDGDELYFSAWAFQQPYRDKTIARNIVMAQTVVNSNVDGICRRLDQADFCGQGPGFFTSGEKTAILYASNIYFFARKFQLNLNDDGRIAALEIYKSKQKVYIQSLVSEDYLKQVAGMAVSYQSVDKKYIELSQLSIREWRVFPRLLPSSSCYSKALIENLHGIQEFQYWIDFVSLLNLNVSSHRVAVTAKTTANCFTNGELVLIHLTTRKENKNVRLVSQPYNPTPGLPPSKQLFINLFFTKTKNQLKNEDNVKKSAQFTSVNNMPGLLQMAVRIRVHSPTKKDVCASEFVIIWNTEIKKTRSYSKISHLHHLVLECDLLTPGWWTLNVFQLEVEDPFIYIASFLIIDVGNEMQQMTENFLKLWIIDGFSDLPLPEYDVTNASSESHMNLRDIGKNRTIPSNLKSHTEEL